MISFLNGELVRKDAWLGVVLLLLGVALGMLLLMVCTPGGAVLIIGSALLGSFLIAKSRP